MRGAGRKRGKAKQAVRCIRMMMRLVTARHGYWISTLADEFSVSERQVRRDLDVLEEAGVMIDRERMDPFQVVIYGRLELE